jgi:hypothetical protein
VGVEQPEVVVCQLLRLAHAARQRVHARGALHEHRVDGRLRHVLAHGQEPVPSEQQGTSVAEPLGHLAPLLDGRDEVGVRVEPGPAGEVDAVLREHRDPVVEQPDR